MFTSPRMRAVLKCSIAAPRNLMLSHGGALLQPRICGEETTLAWSRAAEYPYMSYAAQGIFTSHSRPVRGDTDRSVPAVRSRVVSGSSVGACRACLMPNWQRTSGSLWRRCGADWKRGGDHRPELMAAVRQARFSLDHLAPQPAKQTRHRGTGKSSLPLQEGQRKAVRAALVAGVAPTQVAKHFGLSLAAVRKVLDETG